MNLYAAVQLRFGGPGSGCRGPSCGRPATGKAELANKAHEFLARHDAIQGSELRDKNTEEHGLGYAKPRLYNQQRLKLTELAEDLEKATDDTKMLGFVEKARSELQRGDVIWERTADNDARDSLNKTLALIAQDSALYNLHRAIELAVKRPRLLK